MEKRFHVTADVVYKKAEGAELRLDIGVDEAAAPAGEGDRRPIIMMIPGGAWLSGNRAIPGTRILMQRFAQRGFLVSSVSYRVSSSAIFPAQLQDVWDAVRWLRDNAYRLGANGDSVGAMGHSAGGHLAALLGLTWIDRSWAGTVRR